MTIRDKAKERAIDYNPWEDNLNYKEYFEEGYVVGQQDFIKDIKKHLEMAWENGREFLIDQYGGEGGEFTGAENFEEYYNDLIDKLFRKWV